MSTALISAQTRVESPFIIAKIGSYTFGKFDKKTTTQKQYSKISVTYPNFMEALNITKINGAVNTYTLRMVYGITQNDDPNMLEKVFSSVSKSRKSILSSPSCLISVSLPLPRRFLRSIQNIGETLGFSIGFAVIWIRAEAAFTHMRSFELPVLVRMPKTISSFEG